MRTFREIKASYGFTEDDEKLLASLSEMMRENQEGAMDALHSWILGTREAAKFFSEDVRRRHVFEAQKNWFRDLFSGTYNSAYYEKLIRIGQSHEKSMVDAHFMSRSVNIIRNFCIGVLSRNIEDQDERIKAMVAVEKILDINLDVITSAYIEEEMRSYSPGFHVKNRLISFAERFSQTMNFVLVLALIGLSLAVIVEFTHHVLNLFSGDLKEGIITSFGSMLILWVMIELMNTEISHLKGGKFYISIFVGVALVTIIRDAMIAILKHERQEIIYSLIAAILVIGVVYWLVKKTEERGR